MDKIDTGLSLNGLLSSVTSTTKHSEYRTGFGSKDILNTANKIFNYNNKRFSKILFIKRFYRTKRRII